MSSSLLFTVFPTVTVGKEHAGTPYRLKIQLGGLVAVLAPAFGKEPADIHVWILEGEAWVVVRM